MNPRGLDPGRLGAPGRRRPGPPRPSTRPSARLAAPECVRVGGLSLARLDVAAVVEHLFDALAAEQGGWLVTANVDFAQRSLTNPEISRLYAEADLTVADGTPLVWAARLQGRPLPERVAGSDLVWLLAERAAAEGRSIYLLGGDGDAGVRAADVLVTRYPELRIAGVSSPWLSLPPKAKELRPLVEEVAEARPDIVYAAMGSPKQEYVIRALREALPTTWFMGCGISLSFIAGDVVRAPGWMQRCGLEWLHRLGQEPGRLARRYLRDNLPFALRLLYGAVRRQEP